MSHAPRFSTSSTFSTCPIDLPGLSSLLLIANTPISIAVIMSSPAMLTDGTGCLLTGFFCNQKSPAEYISLDTSERKECNRVRRSRTRNEVFTDGENWGYVTWRYVLATRIRRAW